MLARSGVAAQESEASATPAPKRFNFVDVYRRAEEMAAKPFADDESKLPKAIGALSYDEHRDIRFQPEKALWRDEGLPFEVQFFHRGFLFKRRVIVNSVEDGKVTPVAYSKELFDYGANTFPDELPPDLGFAGFRLHYPLNRDNYYDEVAVFLGASYFRAIGQNQNYGLSGRGLAIDAGLPKAEEFPVFREFWIEKPKRDATEIIVYALLDSKSVTGAYRFVIRPGRETVMDVKTRVFMREKVQRLGIAPLTSMFFHGENTNRFIDDFRPEVHDSDGLLIEMGSGEWIWRPLNNLKKLRVSSFQDTNPRGFGLLQRDRNFDHYQDLEAFYQKRPSVWVEPIKDWGKGIIQLIEIPSKSEKYDNIVAFWVPDKPVEPGQEWAFDYRLYFALEQSGRPPAGRVWMTRIGAGGVVDLDSKRRKFVVDFRGESLEKIDPETSVEGFVSVSSGKIINKLVYKNQFTGGWRVVFELIPENDDPVELRCFLRSAGDVLTETWSYQWIAD